MPSPRRPSRNFRSEHSPGGKTRAGSRRQTVAAGRPPRVATRSRAVARGCLTPSPRGWSSDSWPCSTKCRQTEGVLSRHIRTVVGEAIEAMRRWEGSSLSPRRSFEMATRTRSSERGRGVRSSWCPEILDEIGRVLSYEKLLHADPGDAEEPGLRRGQDDGRQGPERQRDPTRAGSPIILADVWIPLASHRILRPSWQR